MADWHVNEIEPPFPENTELFLKVESTIIDGTSCIKMLPALIEA